MDPVLVFAVLVAILFVFAWFMTAVQLWLIRERQKGVAGLIQLVGFALHGSSTPEASPSVEGKAPNRWSEIVLYSCILGVLLYILPYTRMA